MTGVLGGLVFVGLEMQQTQNIAIAGQQQGRANESRIIFSTGVIETGLDFQPCIFSKN